MRPRVLIWLGLVLTHLVAGVLGWIADADRLAAIIAGSIYLPLWPFGRLGVPVFHQTGWYFPPPTNLGWVLVVVFWLVTYWYVAASVVWFLARRSRAA
jgi:hypothetical protein